MRPLSVLGLNPLKKFVLFYLRAVPLHFHQLDKAYTTMLRAWTTEGRCVKTLGALRHSRDFKIPFKSLKRCKPQSNEEKSVGSISCTFFCVPID